jgi:hypothetical protein
VRIVLIPPSLAVFFAVSYSRSLLITGFAMKKYHEEKVAWMTEICADREEWVELLGSTPSDATLRHLGISRRTWSGIASGQRPRVPMAAYRLATFQRHGELSELLGRAWGGFFVCGDTLGLPRPQTAPERPGNALHVGKPARAWPAAQRSGSTAAGTGLGGGVASGVRLAAAAGVAAGGYSGLTELDEA